MQLDVWILIEKLNVLHVSYALIFIKIISITSNVTSKIIGFFKNNVTPKTTHENDIIMTKNNRKKKGKEEDIFWLIILIIRGPLLQHDPLYFTSFS